MLTCLMFFIADAGVTDAAGAGGPNTSGTATGGAGAGVGPGGNSYTGSTGPSRGGDVYNSAGTIENSGGASESLFLVVTPTTWTEDLLQMSVVQAGPTELAIPWEGTHTIEQVCCEAHETRIQSLLYPPSLEQTLLYVHSNC